MRTSCDTVDLCSQSPVLTNQRCNLQLHNCMENTNELKAVKKQASLGSPLVTEPDASAQ